MIGRNIVFRYDVEQAPGAEEGSVYQQLRKERPRQRITDSGACVVIIDIYSGIRQELIP
ncbi:hypothetical protein SAMN02927921_02276 [Sinomicrobium oceani]|uniref:Uncharacterized protein n=1 Tax=Sinomicrobium oceani TaxID=1150368 RepID=A0A1K1Q4W9_9FLAO|nr:hypothetical protein SAMN02927921_02276 [Sinomicrobium oceani]